MDLVQTLKTQHANLEEKCAALNARLEENDAAGARAVLAELRADFLAHVLLEKEKLYPALLAKTEAQDAKAQTILTRSFEGGVGIIVDALERVTARHAQTDAVDALATEWATLLHALRSRITAEESSLYPMYSRFVGR